MKGPAGCTYVPEECRPCPKIEECREKNRQLKAAEAEERAMQKEKKAKGK